MVRRIALILSFLLAASSAAADDAAMSTVRIGGDVEVSEPTDGPLNAVGGHVTIAAPVKGSLRAAGGEVEVNAPVGGDAFLAGGNVVVKGPVSGNLHVGGGQVTIDGSIGGDAFIGGGSLTLGPSAVIQGKLKFRGGNLTQDPAAQVVGGVIHNPGRAHRHEMTAGDRMTHGWVWSVGLVALAALLAGALPGPSQRLAEELRERPWMTTLVGFLALTAIPVAAVLVMITIIGIPIGILALILYAGLLMFGYVWLAVVLGGLLLDRFKAETAAVTAWRVGAAALAMIVMAVVTRVPYVGGFFKFAALIVGVGMIVAAVMRRVQPPAATPTPTPQA